MVVQCRNKWKNLEYITLNMMENFHLLKLLVPFVEKADIGIIVLCTIPITLKWKYLRAGLMSGKEILVLRIELKSLQLRCVTVRCCGVGRFALVGVAKVL